MVEGPVIAARALDVKYGAIHAVQGAEIEAPRGEVTALIGSNGAGKSSTLKAMAGLVQVEAGRIEIDGVDITRSPAPERVTVHGVVLVPEGRSAFVSLTVRENLGLGMRIGRRRSAGSESRSFDLDDAYSLFPVLRERADMRAQYLSGGEQQMLAIARSLLMQPRVLLIDEPSMGLAPMLVRQIFGVLRKILAEHDVTVLLVEQDTAVALELANSAYVIEQGRITTHASAQELRGDPRLRSAYLGSTAPAAASGPPSTIVEGTT